MKYYFRDSEWQIIMGLSIICMILTFVVIGSISQYNDLKDHCNIIVTK